MAEERVMRHPLVRIVLAILVAGALAWFVRHWVKRTRVSSSVVAADSSAAGVRAARLYFASPSGDSLVVESREMVEAANLHDRVARLMAELDRGPRGGGTAALPAGTAALHVFMDDRGLLTLDLSGAFQRGFRGGSNAEYLAVASLVRTLAANLPEVKRVLIVCGGKPLATLGGHLPLDQPLDVNEWP
jgi:sporulation and spore germination protein